MVAVARDLDGNMMRRAATTSPAERATPTAHVAAGKSLQERLRYLEEDAGRILQEPGRFDAATVRWAHDMVASASAPEVRARITRRRNNGEDIDFLDRRNAKRR
jgi:hypothetical protein